MSSSIPTAAKPLPQIPPKVTSNLSVRTRPQLPQSPPSDRPRRDSDTLPSNSHQLKNLAITQYHRIEVYQARDSAPKLVQYWISADAINSGQFEEKQVPAGHWPKLVQLAKDVCGDRSVNSRQETRFLTAFYSLDEEIKVDIKVESLPPDML